MPGKTDVLITGTGELVAGLVTGEHSTIDPHPFRVARFT